MNTSNVAVELVHLVENARTQKGLDGALTSRDRVCAFYRDLTMIPFYTVTPLLCRRRRLV